MGNPLKPALAAFINKITTNILVWGLDEEGLLCLDMLLAHGAHPGFLMGYDSDPEKVKRALNKCEKFSSWHFYFDKLNHEEFSPRYWEEYNPMYFCRAAFVTVPPESRGTSIVRLIEEHRLTLILCPAPAWGTPEEEEKIKRYIDTQGVTISTWANDGPEALIKMLFAKFS